VNLANKLGVLTLAVLLFATPTMACLLPTATLTAAERECCKQMAEQCGNAGMPSSHSCCQRLTGPDDLDFVKAQSPCVGSDLLAVAVDCAPAMIQSPLLNRLASIEWLDGIHGPPESPPVTTSILRI